MSCLQGFWKKMKPLRPHHPLFELPEKEWGHAIPIYLLADEGRGFKKAAIMIMGFEPVLGYGCDAEDDAAAIEQLKLNFKGNTFKTRQLFTVIPKLQYSKNATPLEELLRHLSTDLCKCFSGLRLPKHATAIRLVTLGLKGDWPALSKLGSLERHFLREAYPHGAGLCHLCMASSAACPSWHEMDFETAGWVKGMDSAPLPWKAANESWLTYLIPMEPEYKARFFHIDLFHTCHKGVHADLAGSALVSWWHVCCVFCMQ